MAQESASIPESLDGESAKGMQPPDALLNPPDSWAALKLRSLVDAPSPSESPALLAALRAVSEFYTQNTASARRSLRPQLEDLAIETSEAVLAAFAPAQEGLSAVLAQVTSMQADIAALSGRLAAARIGASDVVSETGSLRNQLRTAHLKEVACTAFVARFNLRPDERDALAGEEVNKQFLAALSRLERIHEESRALLRSKYQRAGLEALEFAATTREEAYEKVFRFVQARCGTIDVDAEEQEEEAALLRSAIRALRSRPMLLRYCAEEVGSARRASLVGKFITALTKGGPGGLPRPIEMHAHDPMRYTNDMLAWIHQSLASEKELTYRLFAADSMPKGYLSGRKDVPSIPSTTDERVREHNDELALKVLNTVFDALCRPFRIRFEQALEQQLPVVVLYRLASLLEFYAGMMSDLLGPVAALPEMLMECNSIAMYSFFSAWKSKMESFRLSGAGPSEDLTPPPAVQQSMTRLDEIMATLDGSLAPKSAQQGQIAAILEVILNPLLSLCDSMAAKAATSLDAHVLLANCIDAMRLPLAAYSFAAERVEQLALSADNHIDMYIELASEAVLRRCGLADRVRILEEAREARARRVAGAIGVVEEDEVRPVVTREGEAGDGREIGSSVERPLARRPGMDIESLSICIKNFYALLFGGSGIGSADALLPPSVNKITNVRARNRAKNSIAEMLAHAHEDIIAAVMDPENEYGEHAAASIGLRDAAKVTVLLTGRL
jgi:conserved oligomeric Golgi complex subunit 6